jgi:hypothetical protein
MARAHARGTLELRTLIVGTNGEAAKLATFMRSEPVGFFPVGFVSAGDDSLVNRQWTLWDPAPGSGSGIDA